MYNTKAFSLKIAHDLDARNGINVLNNFLFIFQKFSNFVNSF